MTFWKPSHSRLAATALAIGLFAAAGCLEAGSDAPGMEAGGCSGWNDGGHVLGASISISGINATTQERMEVDFDDGKGPTIIVFGEEREAHTPVESLRIRAGEVTLHAAEGFIRVTVHQHTTDSVSGQRHQELVQATINGIIPSGSYVVQACIQTESWDGSILSREVDEAPLVIP